MEYVSVDRCESIWIGMAIADSVICADASSVSTCSGDSGGPLVIENDGEWKLIGMTSWGHVYCDVDDFPQGFSNIQSPNFNRWMRKIAEIW